MYPKLIISLLPTTYFIRYAYTYVLDMRMIAQLNNKTRSADKYKRILPVQEHLSDETDTVIVNGYAVIFHLLSSTSYMSVYIYI